MSQTKLMTELDNVLKKSGEKYYLDGVLNKTRVIEDLHNYNPELITLLSESDIIKKHFLIEINGNKIIKINDLIEIFEMNEYWDDSYTTYENKIGLTSDDKFLSDNTDVILSFPYKDTVLKASMSKEEREKEDLLPEEPFLNEKIAREEIDTLFDRKILINAERYNEEGRQDISEFSVEDNIILKGNNLLALHSLHDKYAGKIKLIYIDPPFNTNNDSFKYNDSFARSSWLVFMKNRLEIAKELLADDGSIFVHIDGNQAHYLKILMDEIFGEDKFMNEIIWRYRTYIGQVKEFFPKKHDTIFWYIKEERPDFKQTNVGNFEDTPDYKRWKEYLTDKGEIVYPHYPKTDSRFEAYLNRYKKQYGNPKDGDIIYQNKGYVVDDVWEDIIALDAKNETERIAGFSGSGQKPEALIQRIIESVTNENDIVLDFFMGSATTQAVAHKMNRRYIGIEQMNYINTVSVPRLQKVIEGEQGGISKDMNWHGGGSFVCAELMEKNTGYLKDILNAESTERLREIFNIMLENADFDFRVDLEEVKDSVWRLPLEDQKRTLVKIIDKNQLYYNYSEIDDENVRDLISDSDYAFNKSFYENEGGENE